jgi:hypothetical protein
MKKTLLLFIAIISHITGFSQAPTLEIVQPTCASPFGMVTVNSPLSSVGAIASDLFISEVTDANLGGLSYIEIYNGTGATVNLSNYKLKVYSNGSSSASCDLALVGSLTVGSVFVVAVGSTTNQGGVVPNQTFAACGGFNINDAVMLTTSAGVAIDLWGSTAGVTFTPLGQPGYTYRRNINAPAPSLTWNVADWTALDPEDYTNVGTYSAAVTYQYNLDGGTYQTSPSFGSLTAGNHYIIAQNMSTGVTGQTSFDIIAVSVTPAVTDFAYPSPICQTNTVLIPTMITGFTPGGVFSCPTIPSLSAVNGGFLLSQAPPGVHFITYTVASDNALCVSGGVSTFMLTITPPSAMPSGPLDQTPTAFNPNLSNLIIFPTNVTWYGSYVNAVSGSNPLSNSMPVVDGAIYYAVNNTNGCPSSPLPVTVHVNLSTTTFTAFSFTVVPNPTRGKLTIQSPTNVTVEKIIISDLSGKTVFAQTDLGSSINIEQLAAGMYLIEGFSGAQRFQSKFVKE